MAQALQPVTEAEVAAVAGDPTDLAVEETGLAVIDPAPPEDQELIRRRELGAFLRSRRERIGPEQLGIVALGRRRTPGLRREEVARLAGVGVTWYTWLEQGRDIRPSEAVLEAIARTLLFDPHERHHLFVLSGLGERPIEQECRSLLPAAQVMLDRLEPFPAAVLNARRDILAFNRAWGLLIDDVSSLPFEDRNCMWLVFTHPRWRKALVDWEETAARMAAEFRAAMAEHVAEPAWKALVVRLLQASPEFAEVWRRHEVVGPTNRTKVIRSPRGGLLRLDRTSLWFGPRPGTQMVTYTPADEASRRGLDRLVPEPAGP